MEEKEIMEKRFEKEWEKSNSWEGGQFGSLDERGTTEDEIAVFQPSKDGTLAFLKNEISLAVKERDKQYKEIFNWLDGSKGDDFPDLSQKPHYRFRSEMRRRLEALLSKDISK